VVDIPHQVGKILYLGGIIPHFLNSPTVSTIGMASSLVPAAMFNLIETRMLPRIFLPWDYKAVSFQKPPA
jgi:hypothetical protein